MFCRFFCLLTTTVTLTVVCSQHTEKPAFAQLSPPLHIDPECILQGCLILLTLGLGKSKRATLFKMHVRYRRDLHGLFITSSFFSFSFVHAPDFHFASSHLDNGIYNFSVETRDFNRVSWPIIFSIDPKSLSLLNVKNKNVCCLFNPIQG